MLISQLKSLFTPSYSFYLYPLYYSFYPLYYSFYPLYSLYSLYNSLYSFPVLTFPNLTHHDPQEEEQDQHSEYLEKQPPVAWYMRVVF